MLYCGYLYFQVFFGELVIELVRFDRLHVDFEVLFEVLPMVIRDFPGLPLVLGLLQVVEQADRRRVLQVALLLELGQIVTCVTAHLSRTCCS